MTKKTKKVVEEEVKDEVVEETVEEEVEEEETEEEVKGIAVVHYLGKTREYSKEIHGKDYKKLAGQFASKYRGAEVK